MCEQKGLRCARPNAPLASEKRQKAQFASDWHQTARSEPLVAHSLAPCSRRVCGPPCLWRLPSADKTAVFVGLGGAA